MRKVAKCPIVTLQELQGISAQVISLILSPRQILVVLFTNLAIIAEWQEVIHCLKKVIKSARHVRTQTCRSGSNETDLNSSGYTSIRKMFYVDKKSHWTF